jgi:diadenylate cyclase
MDGHVSERNSQSCRWKSATIPFESVPVLRWQSLVDFFVVLAAVYLLLVWGKHARVLRIALGIVGLRAAALLARQFDLALTAWVLDGASILALLLLLVIFQPELRQALLQLDITVQRWGKRAGPVTPALLAIGEAAFALAQSGRGALMVIMRRDSTDDLVSGGVPLGGEISRQILEAIFRKVSPVHDGATIIDGNRIARVGVILPLTHRDDVPSSYGTRHRAALGLAERCDAVVVAVSEERGVVTLIHDRQNREISGVADLVQELQALCTVPEPRRPSFRKNLGLKAAAVGLTMLIWGISLGITGTTVRTVIVPVEFSNVPAGMRITRISATTLQVQLRGAAWVFDSVNLSRLAARFDLSRGHEGEQTVYLQDDSLSLPPGVRVERASPERVSIVLARK